MIIFENGKKRIELIIDSMIKTLIRYPEFEYIKEQINKEKERFLEQLNNCEDKMNNISDNKINFYIAIFEAKILELFSSFKQRKEKVNKLQSKLIKLLANTDNQNSQYNSELTSMINSLEDSSKDYDFDKKYQKAFMSVKNLEKEIIAYKSKQLNLNLVEIKNNKINSLLQIKSLDSSDELFRINMLYLIISRLQMLCEKGLINYECLIPLYDFDFSKNNEFLVELIEEKINTPNSTNILIDLNPLYDFLNSFKQLNISRSDLTITNICNNKITEYSLDNINSIFSNYISLDDFLYKADLIGGEIFHMIPLIAIAKLNNIYLVYDSKKEKYYFINSNIIDIVYINNKSYDIKTQKILEEIENHDIETIKKRIVDFVVMVNKEYKNNESNTDKIKPLF